VSEGTAPVRAGPAETRGKASGHGGFGLAVGLDHLSGIFQPVTL